MNGLNVFNCMCSIKTQINALLSVVYLWETTCHHLGLSPLYLISWCPQLWLRYYATISFWCCCYLIPFCLRTVTVFADTLGRISINNFEVFIVWCYSWYWRSLCSWDNACLLLFQLSGWLLYRLFRWQVTLKGLIFSCFQRFSIYFKVMG